MHDSSPSPARLRLLRLLLVAALLPACARPPAGRDPDGAAATPSTVPDPAGARVAGLGTVVLLGDSVAVGEGLPLAAAFGAAGVTFRSLASEGGGNVVGPFAEEGWETLAERLAAAGPTTVIYQLTTFDWGTGEEQRDAYRRLLDTVTGLGAELVLVTSPPIRPDEFYQPHLAELAEAPAAAGEVAAGSDGAAVLLDASEVWGGSFEQTRDGVPDRNPDGIHTCPQGAARFTVWLLDELARMAPGFTAPDPGTWVDTGWTADDHFAAC